MWNLVRSPMQNVLLIHSWFVIHFLYGRPIPASDRSTLTEQDRDASRPARASFPAKDCNIRDASLWLLRQGPIQFSRLILGLLMQFLICLIGYFSLCKETPQQLQKCKLHLLAPKITLIEVLFWEFESVSSGSSVALLGLLYFQIGVSKSTFLAYVTKLTDVSSKSFFFFKGWAVEQNGLVSFWSLILTYFNNRRIQYMIMAQY